MHPRLLAVAALLIALLALPAGAGAADADFNYVGDADGTWTVTGCAAACPAAIVIPDTHLGDNVKRIASGAFIGQTSITSVQMGAHTELIEGNAFRNATSLTSVVLSASVREIGDLAFTGDTALTDITIPSGVTFIGGQAFDSTHLTSIVVPDTVTTIGSGAFQLIPTLTSARLPAGLAVLQGNLFAYDTLLSDVTLPTAFTSIGGWAFAWTAITEIALPPTVASIETCAFFDIPTLTAVRFRGDPPVIASDVYCGDGADGPHALFDLSPNAIVYRASGTTGWGATYDGVAVRDWAPATPGTPRGVARARSILATVTAGAGGVAADEIEITASPGGRSCTVAGTGGTCTITGLRNGRAYTLTAVARNGGGDAGASAPSRPVVPHGAKAIPLAAKAKAHGATVEISFTAVAAGTARAVGKAGAKAACRTSTTVAKPGTARLVCSLGARARSKLPATIVVAVTFTTATDHARFARTLTVRVAG